MKSTPQLRSLISSLAIVCTLGLAGCQSGRQPGSASHASVQIQGRSLDSIFQTVDAVFGEEGYAATAVSADLMVFERPGSRQDAAKWGGWSGAGVTMRVRLRITPLPQACYLLEADAYAIQNSDDPFFQTESRNMLLNHWPYQKLLNEVAKRLK